MGKASVIMHKESAWQFIMKLKKNELKQSNQGLLQLVLFELLYKGLFVLLMLPLLEFSLRFAIKFSGYSYVTIENLVPFIFKPLTVLTILVLAILLFLFSFVEIISLILFFRNQKEHFELEVPHIFFPGIKKAFTMLRKQNIVGIITATVLFAGISNIPLWVCLYMRFSMIRFVLTTILGIQAVRITLIILLIIFMIIGLLGSFVMHYCCIRGTSFRKGLVSSFQLMKKNPVKIAGKILLPNLVCLFIEAVVYILVLLLLTVLAMLFVQEERLVVFLLKAEAEWQIYGGLLLTTFGVVMNMKVLSDVFYQVSPDKSLANETVLSDDEIPPKLANRWILLLAALVVIGNITNIIIIVRNGSYIENTILWENAITAHRGDSSGAPENTLASIELAIENLADYAEIDVQETRDGVVVLLHDYSLKRTTGRSRYIWNVTYDELRYYDCGSWFSRKYIGERIPTLEQVLELCKGRINLNIEIKDSAYNQALEEKVVALIKEFEFENQCVITSTSLASLKKVKKLNEDLKTGYIMSIAYGNFYEAEDIDFFSMKYSFVTQEVVSKAHSFGKEVHVWTVNSRSELERMKNLGVDNIITDVPLFAREVLSGDGILNTFGELLRMMMQN